MKNRIDKLIEFAVRVEEGNNVKELCQEYSKYIETITPKDLFLIENEQIKKGETVKAVLQSVDKLINIFYEALKDYNWEKPKEDSFLYYLMEENKGLLVKLDSFRVLIKRQNYEDDRKFIIDSLNTFVLYNSHLLKLENILFPYMEKKAERFEGLKIMWSLHDEVRDNIKTSISLISEENINEKELNRVLGKVFFGLRGLVQKQELIMFPAAVEILDENEFKAMHIQSFEYEFPYIDKPMKPRDTLSSLFKEENIGEGIIKMETGSFTFEQMEAVINVLPVDITFVNKDDKVAFFSKPNERIFPRSVAIIGRDVRNCHPPESVHVVEEILARFKKGEKDSESFWLKLKGMFILIQYYAVRNDKGDYLGTLEVGQEVSNIKALEGEKRLLDN